MTEAHFQQTVIDMARLLGWHVYHTHDSRRSEPGFPDLCLVRDRIVFLELKTESGRVTDAQGEWIAAINNAGGTALVVRPSDMGEIERALKRRVEVPAPGLTILDELHLASQPEEGDGPVTRRMKRVMDPFGDEAA